MVSLRFGIPVRTGVDWKDLPTTVKGGPRPYEWTSAVGTSDEGSVREKDGSRTETGSSVNVSVGTVPTPDMVDSSSGPPTDEGPRSEQ